MNKLKITFIILLAAIFSSCLTSNLDDLPTYSDSDIINVKFEYRWSIKEGTSDKLVVKSLPTDYAVDKDKNEVTCIVTVPEADDVFTEEIRSKVALNNIIAYTTISSAAVIKPIGDSPVLGKPGDWTSPNEYDVTAANGDNQRWTIKVVEFKK